jgi:hypothetical protein
MKEGIVKTIRIVLVASLFLFLLAGHLCADGAKLNTPLKFLKHARETGLARAKVERPSLAAARSENVTVTVKFDHALSSAEIASLEGRGVSFFRIDGEVTHTGPFYAAQVPWDAMDELSARNDIVKLDAAWRPAVFPCLDVSAHEIEADTTWRHSDPLGSPLTGKGMRIADFDTGIDVFHPSFFYADGDTFDWIDVNLNGTFTPHTDCVDLNGNGTGDANERLSYFDGIIYDPALVWGTSSPSNNGNGYQAYWDWLYNDANSNYARDYGTGVGFTESSPTYGEQVFIAIDADDDGALDVGEKLVALKTSKVYATMTAGAVERRRGIDLIQNEADANGHGSSVAGILAGGTVDRHIFTGIAPDAEILMGYFFSGNPISALIPWARSRGADVVLYEFGGFVWDYLDGSSSEEELITIENDSIIQVTPSGNLGRGNKHAIATVAPSDSVVIRITVPPLSGTSILEMYNTNLWRTASSDLTFRLKSPIGGMLTLTGSVSFLDWYYVWFDVSTSPRGTSAMNIYVNNDSNPNLNGTWELHVVNETGSPIELISNVADDVSSWAGGAEFLDYYTDQRNVTWPATADGAFVNGSYSTRGFEGYGGVGGGSIPVGEISAFSGRGTRIDGRHLLDIASPGNYDVYSTRSSQDGAGYPVGSYRQFSGTSAAGPHVAAACALVQQQYPSASMRDVAFLITSHAATDAFTGSVYNDTWGWGKLRILHAVGVPTNVDDMARGNAPPRVLLDQNYPNPFNPTTWIPFFLPADGPASIKVYDVRGALVKVLTEKWLPRGAHSVRWNGDDTAGRNVASGIYFCVLRFADNTQTRKLVLLR